MNSIAIAIVNNSVTQPEILLIIGKNSDYQSMNMNKLFYSQDLLDLLENESLEPMNNVSYKALTKSYKDLLKVNKKSR